MRRQVVSMNAWVRMGLSPSKVLVGRSRDRERRKNDVTERLELIAQPLCL
jgi:hypothetical protein